MESDKIKFNHVEGSKRLRVLRKAKSVSYDTLAKDTGINKQSLKNYERAGEGGTEFSTRGDAFAGMSVNNLVTLAKYFDVSTDYLLGLTDIKTPNIEIKAICDYTGLSEKSVNQLHLNKQFSGSVSPCASCVDGVNLLLEDVQHGNNVLGNISDYIRENYDSFLIKSDDKHIVSRNTISLGKDGKPVHDFNIRYMKSVFLVWIQDGIIKLHDKVKGGLF